MPVPMTNRYRANCVKCGKRVAPGDGWLSGTKEHWRVAHKSCPSSAGHRSTPVPAVGPTPPGQRSAPFWMVVAAVAALLALAAFFGRDDGPSEASVRARQEFITPLPSFTPAEPTALCSDGTVSYSQHRQGTCSWHGGVAASYP